MSDNNFNENHPTPDTEAFYQKQFEQWDREAEAEGKTDPPEEQAPAEAVEAEVEPEPPQEQVDANGFRVLTFHVGGRKRGGRRERRAVVQIDEEEDALEAMLEANSNKSEKVTFLPFAARPDAQSDPPAPRKEPEPVRKTPKPVEQPGKQQAQPVAPVPPAQKSGGTQSAPPPEPKAKEPPKPVQEPAQEPVQEAVPAPERGPETAVQSQMPNRLRRLPQEPVMIRMETEEEEEEEVQETPLTAAPQSRKAPPEKSAEKGVPEPRMEPARQAPQPKTSPEDRMEEDEDAELERELEERANRPSLMNKLFGSWFEERMEGQQRQMDADAEYELEHAEEQKGFTGSIYLPKITKRPRGKREKKGRTTPVQTVEGEIVPPAPAEQKAPQSVQKKGKMPPRPAAAGRETGKPVPPPAKQSGEKEPPAPKTAAKALAAEKGEAKQGKAEPGKGSPPPKRSPGKMPEKVIRMPEEHPGRLEQKLNAIREQADVFADTMFASESVERKEEEAEQARVAKLIPATDVEREARPRDIAREERRRKKEEKQRHAPDTSPKELFRIYSSSYKSRHGRLSAQLAAALMLLVVTVAADEKLTLLSLPFLEKNLRLAALVLTVGLAVACAVGLDTLLEGIVWMLRGRPGLNTLASIGTLFTIADGVWYATVGRDGPLPFAGFAALSLWAMAFGSCRKTRGLRDACEDAYTRSEYERLTMDEGKWSGKGVYLKEPGGTTRFGSQIQEPDGVERVYRIATPVMMASCAVFGVLACVAQKTPQMLIWNWSVIFVMATPLSATLAYGLPYARQVLRLRRSGVILAGWDGAESMRGDAGIVLADRDLFPEGTVQMMGIQNFGDISLEKVTGCTASLVRQADMGIAKLFDDQLRMQGGFYRRVEQMDAREESGITGVMRGDTVMIGTAGYLQVHGIEIEPGYQVKNAIFCGVNGNLRGIFALRYELPRGVRPAIMTLLQGGISPILATRDFNITPEVLHTRFKLPSDRMQYPPVQRRFDLSAKGQPHNKVLGALVFREGLGPYTDAILGGKRLCAVVRLNTLLTLLASVLGALLGLYLTAMKAYSSLSLMNTLFFLLMWMVPTVMVSRGVDQF